MLQSSGSQHQSPNPIFKSKSETKQTKRTLKNKRENRENKEELREEGRALIFTHTDRENHLGYLLKSTAGATAEMHTRNLNQRIGLSLTKKRRYNGHKWA